MIKGLGIKVGLCARTCNILYSACIDDYFKYNDLNTLSFCEKNSMICSKARDIAASGEEFCRALGFPQNENENIEEFLEALTTNSTIKPLCFNLKPSSALFGPSVRIKDIEKSIKNLVALSFSMLLLLFFIQVLL